MRLIRTCVAAAALLASLVLAAAASAAATPPSLVVSRLSLDAQSQAPLDHTPARASARLRKGKLYVATVQGTISYYAAIDYLDPQAPFIAFCGDPLSAPQFSSRGGIGKVGNDAQFIFAQPITTGSCAADTLPRVWLNFQANNGFGWAHPTLLSAHPLTKPLSSHTYSYAFVGQNRPLRFELDDPNTRDDYGSLHIVVRRAVRSDCAGAKWKAFGLKTRNACLGSTAHTVGVVPRTPPVAPLTVPQGPVYHVVRGSDFPTAHNLELPAGALDASVFAGSELGAGPAAAKWAKVLTGAGFRSAAISDFEGLADPTVQSTAILLRTPADARKVAAAEVTQGLSSQTASGDAATTSADPAVPGATLITFTPSAAGGSGGDEVVAVTGAEVDTLREIESPSTAVSAMGVEALEATAAAR